MLRDGDAEHVHGLPLTLDHLNRFIVVQPGLLDNVFEVFRTRLIAQLLPEVSVSIGMKACDPSTRPIALTRYLYDPRLRSRR